MITVDDNFREMQKKHNIYIYGAKSVAGMVYDHLAEYQCDVKGFLVSRTFGNPDCVKGLPVHLIYHVMDRKEEMCIVVAVLPQYKKEVVELLLQLGFCNIITLNDEYAYELKSRLEEKQRQHFFEQMGYILEIPTGIEGNHAILRKKDTPRSDYAVMQGKESLQSDYIGLKEKDVRSSVKWRMDLRMFGYMQQTVGSGGWKGQNLTAEYEQMYGKSELIPRAEDVVFSSSELVKAGEKSEAIQTAEIAGSAERVERTEAAENVEIIGKTDRAEIAERTNAAPRMNSTEAAKILEITEAANIYAVKCHKDKPVPNPIPCTYVREIQAGAALTEQRICDCMDNTGDNISDKNRDFSECSAIYWIWKNGQKKEYTGIYHYRRYLDISVEDLQRQMAKGVTLINTIPCIMYPSNKYFFVMKYLYEYDWLLMMDLIRRMKPAYYETALKFEKGHFYLANNIFIMKTEWFDRMCEFVFAILLEIDREYAERGFERQDRYAGYLFEVLYSIFVMHHSREMQIAYGEMIYLKV